MRDIESKKSWFNAIKELVEVVMYRFHKESGENEGRSRIK